MERSSLSRCLVLSVLAACGRAAEPVSTPDPTPATVPSAPAASSPDPGSAASPAPSAAPSASAVTLPSAPYVLASPGCRVAVGPVVSVEHYRGPGPMTPRLADTFQRDPAFQRVHSGISHGDQHIECTYRVEVNGARYRYMAVVVNTFRQHDDGHCEQIRDAVAREIRDATLRCADLHPGEYDGHVLAPP